MGSSPQWAKPKMSAARSICNDFVARIYYYLMYAYNILASNTKMSLLDEPPTIPPTSPRSVTAMN